MTTRPSPSWPPALVGGLVLVLGASRPRRLRRRRRRRQRRPAADPSADASLDVEVERRSTPACASPGRSPTTATSRCWCSTGSTATRPPGEPVQGAYVTGGDGSDLGGGDGVAEISRRLFPVPDDLEGVQQYGTNASELAPGATASQTENVSLPLEDAPAASEGGGDELPDDPSEAVFCLGVGPQDEVDATENVTPGPLVRPARRGEHGPPDAAVQRPVRGVSEAPGRRISRWRRRCRRRRTRCRRPRPAETPPGSNHRSMLPVTVTSTRLPTACAEHE